MKDPHKNPNYVFTSFLSISHLFISHESSQVTLLPCYGNLLNGKIESISIETDFTTLNELLAEKGNEAEEAIEKIAVLLSDPSEGNSVVGLSDSGGLTFEDHIFALLVIYDEDEEGKLIESEEHSYRLNAYIDRQNILPEFISIAIPETHAGRSAYYNSILAMQFQFYLSCRKKQGENTALIMINLTDPFLF